MSIQQCCLSQENISHKENMGDKLLNKSKKSKAYYVHVSFLLAFTILLDAGEKLLNVGQKESGVSSIEIDLDKKEIYKAEKGIRKIQEKIEPFKKGMTKQIKARTSNILKELVVLTSSEKYISAEILGSYLLFNYFCDTNHKIKLDEEFKYFTNENIYYPILDRVEKTNLVDIKSINDKIFTIIKNNKHR